MASRTTLVLVLASGKGTRKDMQGACPKFNLQGVEWPIRSVNKNNARNPTKIRKYARVDVSVDCSGESLQYGLQEPNNSFMSARARCARVFGGEQMGTTSKKVEFPGSQGFVLAARLDHPDGEAKAYALFAHCFTCSKDILAASRIAGSLAQRGFAVLRFDFTGLGASEGEFANTNFSSNVEDLLCAAQYLRREHRAPAVLIGHSLGGAAVLAAAGGVPEAKAVATIGAPSDAQHVVRAFAARLATIESEGEAEVQLAGRRFRIRRQLLDDLRSQSLNKHIANLRKALIVFHAPQDKTVGIENAAAIFAAAKHPKSFISLDDADHLLSNSRDASYVAEVLSSWASRYVES